MVFNRSVPLCSAILSVLSLQFATRCPCDNRYWNRGIFLMEFLDSETVHISPGLWPFSNCSNADKADASLQRSPRSRCIFILVRTARAVKRCFGCMVPSARSKLLHLSSNQSVLLLLRFQSLIICSLLLKCIPDYPLWFVIISEISFVFICHFCRFS